MRTIHVSHLHKPDWEHMRDTCRHLVHRPGFWVIVALLVFMALMIVLSIMYPSQVTPRQYMPQYPYPTGV